MSSTSTKPIPIVLCGENPLVGKAAAQRMLPEVEVIAFISTVEEAKANISALVAGSPPPSLVDEIVGSKDYSQSPAAVVIGGAFTAETLAEIRQSVQHVKPGVPWLTREPNSEGRFSSPEKEGEKYGRVAAHAVNTAVMKLEGEGMSGKDWLYHCTPMDGITILFARDWYLPIFRCSPNFCQHCIDV
ncbi:hypothetical protein K431DRAFT_273459 [Polychaeton citri CBS 116435]|uniref:Uncharacterized protein n=1 Tax=Polychaeton citri CBS 116435 TaxID=1314669 RepID=A0A9P4Q3E2_9PEZI|nr:hypothetical protein K431DRAFT_273459 [Polychaeton citri CBS 116435]